MFFPHIFHPLYPDGREPQKTVGKDQVIPVDKLSHITHDAEAEFIKHEKEFVFLPQRKMGKSYMWDGTPKGESFRADFIDHKKPTFMGYNWSQEKYRYVDSSESLMPEGYYSGVFSRVLWVLEHPPDVLLINTKRTTAELQLQQNFPVTILSANIYRCSTVHV